jgi:hypothetical protein
MAFIQKGNKGGVVLNPGTGTRELGPGNWDWEVLFVTPHTEMFEKIHCTGLPAFGTGATELYIA